MVNGTPVIRFSRGEAPSIPPGTARISPTAQHGFPGEPRRRTVAPPGRTQASGRTRAAGEPVPAPRRVARTVSTDGGSPGLVAVWERRRPRRPRRRHLLGQAQVPEDPRRHRARLQQRQEPQPPPTARTRQHLDVKGSPHQVRPPPPGGTARRAHSGARLPARTGRRGAPRGPRYHLGSPRRVRSQHPVVQPQVIRGRGTSTASRSRNAVGSKRRWVVPSAHGWRSCSTTRPAPSADRRSPVTGGRRT